MYSNVFILSKYKASAVQDEVHIATKAKVILYKIPFL